MSSLTICTLSKQNSVRMFDNPVKQWKQQRMIFTTALSLSLSELLSQAQVVTSSMSVDVGMLTDVTKSHNSSKQ